MVRDVPLHFSLGDASVLKAKRSPAGIRLGGRSRAMWPGSSTTAKVSRLQFGEIAGECVCIRDLGRHIYLTSCAEGSYRARRNVALEFPRFRWARVD
jgi:hypothetical protein